MSDSRYNIQIEVTITSMKICHYLNNKETTSHGATGKQLLKYGADVKIK